MRKWITVVLLLGSGTALAAGPFDGTWKARMDSMKVTGKPDSWVLADGMYECASCSPPYKVKADGRDQKVSGHSYYDTVAVTVVSPTAIEVSRKKAGKQVAIANVVVASDGNTLTGTFKDYTGATVATGSFSAKRVAGAPAGSHAASGSWLTDKMMDANDAATVVSYQMTETGLSARFNGQSYEAKFDGKDYPVKGDPGGTVVSLRKVDANTVIETDKREGKVVDEVRMAAAADGKTIAVSDNAVPYAQVTTYTLEKQP